MTTISTLRRHFRATIRHPNSFYGLDALLCRTLVGPFRGDHHREKGLLIALEGIDASGKNTQSQMLYQWLRSKKLPTELLSFPDYSTFIGQEIKSFLTGLRDYDKETRHILYAANRYEHKTEIEKWSKGEKKIVIINRYSDSNIAYGVANGLSSNWLKAIESLMPQPDWIFLLRATPELSKVRKKDSRDVYETDMSFLKRVSEVYDALVEKGRWFVIDADRPVENIHYEITRLFDEVILGKD